MLKSKQLREQRAKMIADARTMLDAAKTAEERAKFDTIMSDADAMLVEITRHEKIEGEERSLATLSAGEREAAGDGDADGAAVKAEIEKRAKAYSKAFRNYLQFGVEEMSPEERATLKAGFVAPDKKEGRAQTITTTGGGYTIPQGFQAELEKAQLAFGAIRKYARILRTAMGNPIPWPTTDDTGNTGEDATINTGASAQDVVFGQKTLNAYKLDSGLVLVPNELFEDVGINLEAELGEMLGERLGRRQSSKYATGAGVTDFQGFVVGASLGKTAAAVAAVTADELIDLQHSVDPAYRENPNVAFAMHDTTLQSIRKLKDSQGRYLLQPGLTAGVPYTLLGKPVAIVQEMAQLATGNKTIVFGDFRKFIIRDVRDIVVRRLNERYAEADQVGFIAWYRGDSRVVSASAKALTYLVQA